MGLTVIQETKRHFVITLNLIWCTMLNLEDHCVMDIMIDICRQIPTGRCMNLKKNDNFRADSILPDETK